MNSGYNALRASRRRWRREEIAGRPAALPTPEAEVSQREEQQRVRDALARIAPRGAKLLVLREMGFSYQEMAGILGVAPGSVGTLLARAQKAFRRAYGEENEDEAYTA
jgi:RNA polymerase sigma-70 factor (ECF subfamily)